MKFIFTLEEFKYSTIGEIQDETETQYKINGKWYHKDIIELTDKPIKNITKNKGRISPKKIISAFENIIDVDKLEKYTNIFNSKMLSHGFPPIKGYPNIIDESDVGKEFLSGNVVSEDNIGEYVWVLTDGHHRTLAALEANVPYLETQIDHAYFVD